MKFLAIFQLALVISCAAAEHSTIHLGKEWCVVAVGAPTDKLQAFLNLACSQLDCKAIRPGGSCYQPDTLNNHASYVLNLFFRDRGVCESEIGTFAVSDPSFGKCIYT